MFKKKKDHGVTIAGAEKKTLCENLDFTSMEQYKLLRANLEFVLTAEEKCPVIGITSSIRGEAKSTTSINLSYVLAVKGHKVLLIDGDLRLPSLAKKLDITSPFGLTDLLRGRNVDLEETRSEKHENLHILLSGEIPPNPSELLGSSRMESVLKKLKESFDFIIIDLPPVNIVSDAVAISPMLSGIIVVTREGYATKRDVDECFNQLELARVNILGCVMTCAARKGGSYGRYKYKYYGTEHE